VFIFLSTQNKIGTNVKEYSLLKIKKIEVSGLSKQNNFKLHEELKPLLNKNIFFINKKKFQNILSKNNLIENFYIQKTYPNLIKVNIKKTDLLALTILDDKFFFIGSNEKLISLEQFPNHNKNLPYVFGKISNKKFIKLKKVIDKSNFNFEDISSFYFFQSNRWDIKMNDGTLIKLPHKNLSQALQMAHMIKSNKDLKKIRLLI
jgi:cell division protein FtsQ